MAALGSSYLDVLEKWLYNGYTSLNGMKMTPPQKLRTQIVWEAYQVWLQNKQINPLDLCRKVSIRTYAQLQERAMCDPNVKMFLEQCGVAVGRVRSVNELYNDVKALNHIIATFTAPTADIEKAKVVDASDWLIQHGKKTGDGRDVAKGADIKMRLHKDFDAQTAGYEDLANTDVNITGDVSVVKPDRQNYTDEQKREWMKQYHITEREVTELVQGEDWEEVKSGDVFEEN